MCLNLYAMAYCLVKTWLHSLEFYNIQWIYENELGLAS